ncbi:hypothetical protein [Peribacillus asahii]|uniref:hypothetical protein n=1 Tax=Peribacillus asahii TaxID=228899 RepID=UPI002079E9A2|nr:hypothetical protein [Peribacillus asahii]USK68302.1 hypothetical protein LIS76_11725 [Peribacillus asahii]
MEMKIKVPKITLIIEVDTHVKEKYILNRKDYDLLKGGKIYSSEWGFYIKTGGIKEYEREI